MLPRNAQRLFSARLIYTAPQRTMALFGALDLYCLALHIRRRTLAAKSAPLVSRRAASLFGAFGLSWCVWLIAVAPRPRLPVLRARARACPCSAPAPAPLQTCVHDRFARSAAAEKYQRKNVKLTLVSLVVQSLYFAFFCSHEKLFWPSENDLTRQVVM